MRRRNSITSAAIAAALTLGILTTATWAAKASPVSDAWIAVASSPSRESLDYGYGPNQAAAESNALSRCVQAQKANNCQTLASGVACIATAWDIDQPLNHAHGASSMTSQGAVQAAMAAAGPYANDPQVRCTWFQN